ncbi:hypothetical protein JCM24511_10099 [Saitozyma sp. JCM 24511]|nr:hypothetical protein JCM24511_10099 [Saitozyma sp. JCM 24511]
MLKDAKTAWARDTTPYLVFSALAFAFGDLLFGVDTGSFGSIQALPSFLSEFAPMNAAGVHAFPTRTKSIMNSVVWPGKLLGTIVFEPMVEKIGYKRSMYIVAVIQALTATTWQTFSGCRIVAYFGVGVVENLVPSYLSEIAPAGIRGFFAGIMNIIVALGNLWGSGMGSGLAAEKARVGWIVPAAVKFIPVVAIAVFVPSYV